MSNDSVWRRCELTAAVGLGFVSSLMVLVRLAPTSWGMHLGPPAMLLTTTVLSAFWWKPFVQWLFGVWSQVPSRTARRTLVGCFAGALLLAFASPLTPAPFREASAAIEPVDELVDGATTNEVWVRADVDGEPAPHRTFKNTAGWTREEAFWVWRPGSPRGVLTWEGRAARSVQLVFRRSEASSQVRVKSTEVDEVVELFSVTSDERRVELLPDQHPPAFLPKLSRAPGQILVDLLSAAFLGVLLFALVARFTFPQPTLEPASTSFGFDLWFHAIPMLWLGLWLLCLYFPAVMTVDSLGQWAQAMSGEINDAHPVTHTLLMSALMKLWNSPAIVAIVQLVALAGATSALITVLQRALGAPTWAARVSACLIHPMVAITSITLWKDTLYTVSVIALVAWGAARVLLSPHTAPSRWVTIGGGVIAFFAMMLRHNGPPAALATFALVALFAPAARRSVGVAAGVALALVLVIKGPVSALLHLRPGKMAVQIYAHRIGAHLTSGQLPAAASDRALLKEIEPASDWHYACSVVNATIFASSFKYALATEHSDDLGRIWRELALQHPKEEFKHTLCASSLVWRMDGSDAKPLYLYRTGLEYRDDRVSWVQPGIDSLHESSLFPRAAQQLGRMVLNSTEWWLWRPAVWLYVFTLAVVVGALRTRNRRVLTLLIVPWAHSAALAAVNVAQDARYQLLVYVLGLAPVLLFFTARRAHPAHG